MRPPTWGFVAQPSPQQKLTAGAWTVCGAWQGAVVLAVSAGSPEVGAQGVLGAGQGSRGSRAMMAEARGARTWAGVATGLKAGCRAVSSRSSCRRSEDSGPGLSGTARPSSPRVRAGPGLSAPRPTPTGASGHVTL